jgi:hypothetical protein
MAIIYTNQTSKKKKNLSPKQRELKASWEKIMAKYEPKKKVLIKKDNNLSSNYKLSVPPGRETPHYNSLNSNDYTATKKTDNRYTGNKILGIGTLHKSNAVPVFSDQEAVEIARMRRG